jgi:hypothetical protein
MIRFLFFTDYPGSFTAFSSSVDLPVEKIKKILSNQSHLVLLRLTSTEIVVAPRKNLKLKECFQHFNILMKTFHQQMILKNKPSPAPITTWFHTVPFLRKPLTDTLNVVILPGKNSF